MADGVPYDSDEGRAICAAITAVMTGISYATSAEMAKELGPFPGYEPNKGDMLRVIRNHRRAVQGHKTGYERPDRRPGAADRRRLQGRRPDRGRQARLGFWRSISAPPMASAMPRRPWSRRPERSVW